MSDVSGQEAGSKNKKVVSQTVTILLIIITLILGGLAGYAYGKESATTDAEKELQQQVSSLEAELSLAKAAAGDEIEEDITEGQQTVEALQSENAALKQTIADQNQKIADLEQQLEGANTETTPPIN